MVFTLIAIVLGIILVVGMGIWASQDCEWHNIIAGILAILMGIATGVTIIVYAFCVWNYVGAQYKANIINREYGTSYTKEEIFYGHDVIDTIRELDRTRMEINGDIITGK